VSGEEYKIKLTVQQENEKWVCQEFFFPPYLLLSQPDVLSALRRHIIIS
jgi:hypothetical protein